MHCDGGTNLSTAVVVHYLMTKMQMKYGDAIEQVGMLRPVAKLSPSIKLGESFIPLRCDCCGVSCYCYRGELCLLTCMMVCDVYDGVSRARRVRGATYEDEIGGGAKQT